MFKCFTVKNKTYETDFSKVLIIVTVIVQRQAAGQIQLSAAFLAESHADTERMSTRGGYGVDLHGWEKRRIP